jgi:signal transduction histidine kinase
MRQHAKSSFQVRPARRWSSDLLGGWWLTRRALGAGGRNSRRHGRKKSTRGNLDPENPPHRQRRRTGPPHRGVQRHDRAAGRIRFNRIREFTLHASHELKTPLTILCGEIETALHDGKSLAASSSASAAAGQLDEIHRLARKIVDGLTLLAKADAGTDRAKIRGIAAALD